MFALAALTSYGGPARVMKPGKPVSGSVERSRDHVSLLIITGQLGARIL